MRTRIKKRERERGRKLVLHYAGTRSSLILSFLLTEEYTALSAHRAYNGQRSFPLRERKSALKPNDTIASKFYDILGSPISSILKESLLFSRNGKLYYADSYIIYMYIYLKINRREMILAIELPANI